MELSNANLWKQVNKQEFNCQVNLLQMNRPQVDTRVSFYILILRLIDCFMLCPT